MREIVKKMFFGGATTVNGLIALAVIAFIGLGCFCNKDFDLSKLTNESSSNRPSNIFDSSPSPSPSGKERKTTTVKADASKAEVPSDDEAQEIVKRTLLDFDEALKSEDFTDFHSTIAKEWQRQKTPDELKETFQSFIDGRADLTPIESMDAKFTEGPKLVPWQRLKSLEIKGEYPTSPITTTFELTYLPNGKEWKLSGIVVYTRVLKK